MRWQMVILAVLSLLFVGHAPPGKPPPTIHEVPFRLGPTKHILVRARINGRGPYNLVVDTGAPVVVLAKKLAEPVGIELDETHWADVKLFELEGGIALENLAVRFDDLYQLEGMNGLGLAGVEIHGLLGYPVLARYRIEFDFTKTKMLWTPLANKPEELPRRPGGAMGSAGLQALGAVMKGLGKFIGADQLPTAKPRGFAGLSLVVDRGRLSVTNVVKDGPADRAGIQVGDIVRQAGGKDLASVEAFGIAVGAIAPGQSLILRISRGDSDQDVTIELSEGI